ncbi:MAG: HEAT repeat domain-containing protein [Candidatus Wallbacteria bacterium]|nr:HEAT repeat domain-containing protein [Candidatus Wallbacteria bacterium]
MISQLIQSVKELIRHGSLEEARNGIREAAKLSHDAALPFLYSLFSDQQFSLCQIACDELVGLGKPALTYLKNLYTTADENQKYWSIRTLIRGGKPEVDFLAEIALKEKEEICAFLATQLSAVSDPELAIPVLIALFKKDNWLIKKNCAQSMIAIGKPAVPHLKKLFSGRGRDLKYWVIKVLADIMGKDLYPFLEKMLSENPDTHGYYAMVGLDEINTPDSQQLLVDILNHKKWLLRAEAAEILRKKGKDIVPLLKKAFRKKHPEQQYWIIILLSEIMENRALPFLKEIVQNQGSELRHYAVTALGQVKTSESVTLLIDCLDDRAWIVRKEAAKALQMMGSIALPAVQLGVLDLRENVCFWCIHILSELANWDLNLYLPLLSHPDKKRRIFAVQQALNIRNKDIIRHTVPLLADKHWAVRREAADVLVKMGRTGLETFVKYILEREQNPHLEYWAAYIVGKLPIDTIKQFLSEYLTASSQDREITLALHLLCSIASEEAWELTIQKYISGDKYFRRRFRELIKTQDLNCLIRPFLKALRRTPPEISLEISEILSSISTLEKFKIVREEFFRSTEDQAIWMIKILANSPHPAKYQFLMDILIRDKREKVKAESVGYLGAIKEGSINQVVYKVYMSGTDEEKMLILNTYNGRPDEIMIRELISTLTKLPKQQAFWVAKFLQKYLGVYQKLYQEIMKESDLKTKEWVAFILK